MNQRGDVVLVNVPYHTGQGLKDRPAVIVQCDRNNGRMLSTIVAGVTGNLKRVASEPTQFLVDPATPEGSSSGLAYASAVKCENLFTVGQSEIKKKLGHLSPPLLGKLDECLKASLELP